MKYIVTFICSLYIFCAAAQSSWQQKIDPLLLKDLDGGTTHEVLIDMGSKKISTDHLSYLTKDQKAAYVYDALRDHALKTQQPLKQWLDTRDVPWEALTIVNIIKVKADLNLVQELAQRNDVQRLTSNPHRVMQTPIPSTEVASRGAVEYAIPLMKVDSVWLLGYEGQGVTVGGQDTGYEYEHPALKNKYRGYVNDTLYDHNYNWHDAIHEINPLNGDSVLLASNNPCGLDSPFPCDDHNHGTHTMGTIVGKTDSLEIGVAPKANWCACRNMERGFGTPFTYLECFEWFLAPTDQNNENPDPSKAPAVIANSWSCPPSEGCDLSNFGLLETAVDNLSAAGTVVVVSAGNSGRACHSINTPAAIFESSFTIGATNALDSIAGFSSRGTVMVDSSGRQKPNVVAPGVSILSSIRNGGYARFSGTSMSGPQVVGVIALMISANPDIKGHVNDIRQIIEETAIPLTNDSLDCGGVLGADIPNTTYGYGRVNAYEAVLKALAWQLPTATTAASTTSSVRVYPNPFDAVITVEHLNEQEGDFQLLTTTGQVISTTHLAPYGKYNLSLPTHLPQGVYLYVFRTTDSIEWGKLSKF